MNLKKLLSFVLVLALCLSFFACGREAEKETLPSNLTFDLQETEKVSATEGERLGTATPLLYRVTNEAGNVVWLFGSVHVGTEDFYPLPDYVYDAFDGSDALAVEADIVTLEADLTAQIKLLTKMLYTDGTTISEVIPFDLYEDAVSIFKDFKTYYTVLDMYYPILWSSQIDALLYQKLELDSQLGVDRHLINRANENEKQLLEIESAEEQYDILAGFSEPLQIYFLRESVRGAQEPEKTKEALMELIALWSKGDEQAFSEYLEQEESFESDEEKELYEEYEKAMITDRNALMADYAENALNSDKEVFVCVGAAHVFGDGGIADLLSERGYQVELVK